MRFKKVAGVLASTAVVAVLGFAGTASASEGSTSAKPATGVVVADPVGRVAAEDPAAFNSAVDAVEPYLVTDGSGNLRLEVPAEVARSVDARSYEALQSSVQVFNDMNAATAEAPDAASFGMPSTIVKFVKKYWKQIVDIAKKSGKWAWYKAAQCSAGAMNALYKSYGGNPAGIAEDIKIAIAIAGAGCVANL